MEIWTAALVVLSTIDSSTVSAALCSPGKGLSRSLRGDSESAGVLLTFLVPVSAAQSLRFQVTEGLRHNQEVGVRGKDEALGSFKQVQISSAPLVVVAGLTEPTARSALRDKHVFTHGTAWKREEPGPCHPALSGPWPAPIPPLHPPFSLSAHDSSITFLLTLYLLRLTLPPPALKRCMSGTMTRTSEATSHN
ncbi:hypothetical protein PAMP_018200 [Pampus punctatissimus]